MGDKTDRLGASRYGLAPLLVIGAVNTIDNVDMYIIRGIAPVLSDEWSLNDFQIGLLSFVFIFVNAVATIPAGWLADNLRRTRIVGYTMTSWSLLILLSASAVNFVQMMGARAVMGIGQSFDDPATTSLLADYYPPKQRARAFSLQQIALFAGGGIGVALGGLVASTLGWRWAFVLVGMPGSLLALLAFRLPEPVRGESDDQAPAVGADGRSDGDGHEVGVGAAEADLVSIDTPREPFRVALRRMRAELSTELRFVLGIRTMRYVLVGVSALLFTVAGVGTWLPFYHERYSDMSTEAATAVTGGALGLGGIVGTLAGGWLSDRLLSRRGPAARIHIVVIGGCICAGLFMISFVVPLVALRVLLQILGVTFGAAAAPGLRAAMTDVVPATSRGVSTSAFALCSAVLGTALAPPLVGLLSWATGSLLVAFYIVFPPVLMGMLALWRATHTIVEDVGRMLAMAPAPAPVAQPVVGHH